MQPNLENAKIISSAPMQEGPNLDNAKIISSSEPVEVPQTPQAEPVNVRIDYGGLKINLPGDVKPEQIESSLEKFRQTEDFDRILDKTTGAPARVRMMVGGAPNDEDRLTTIRRFFPDAVPHGEDNFVYTDPETGKFRLFNPEGLDWGDVAGAGREISQGVGSAMGAVFGGAGGFIVGSPTGPGAAITATEGAIVGAGMGNVVGGQVFDLAASLIGERVDTRNLGGAMLDSAVEFGAGAAGEKVGRIIGVGVKKAMGGAKEGAQQLVNSFKQFNITPQAGAVTGSRGLATLEHTLNGAPGSADIMQKQAEKVLLQTQRAAEKLINKFGTAKTQQGAGQVIKRAAEQAVERFGFTQTKAYDEAFDLIGADTVVSLNSIKALRLQMQSELAQAPETLGPTMSGAINTLRMLEHDAKVAGGIPFSALRMIRSNVGKDLSSPGLSGSSGAQLTALKRIYGALTEDLSLAAQSSGKEAAKKLKVADRFTRMWMNTAAKDMDKIIKFDADERAYRFAMMSSKDGGSALARMRKHFTDDEWDTVAATTLHRLGLATPGRQNAAGDAFSVSSFLTNFNKLAPEAKDALFGGKRYANLRPQLDKLVEVIDSMKGAEAVANGSNTGRALMNFALLQGVGGALGAGVAGDSNGFGTGMATTTIGTVLAPRAAAKLITNPKFVEWLVTPMTKTTSISAHFGRLSGIAAEEAYISEEIEDFINLFAPEKAPTGGESN